MGDAADDWFFALGEPNGPVDVLYVGQGFIDRMVRGSEDPELFYPFALYARGHLRSRGL